MTIDKETLNTKPGFAIIGRFVFADVAHKEIISTHQYELTPGKGIIFMGENDSIGEPIIFDQANMERTLKEIPDMSQFQMMALVDVNTGALLFTDLTREGTYGVNNNVPKRQRILIADYGKLSFFGIWDESSEKAKLHLKELQKARMWNKLFSN